MSHPDSPKVVSCIGGPTDYLTTWQIFRCDNNEGCTVQSTPATTIVSRRISWRGTWRWNLSWTGRWNWTSWTGSSTTLQICVDDPIVVGKGRSARPLQKIGWCLDGATFDVQTQSRPSSCLRCGSLLPASSSEATGCQRKLFPAPHSLCSTLAAFVVDAPATAKHFSEYSFTI